MHCKLSDVYDVKNFLFIISSSFWTSDILGIIDTVKQYDFYFFIYYSFFFV